MTRLRIAAAVAALLTALLLQAAIVAPIFSPVPVSLVAVLVAAVALVDGPGAGMALGFSGGLVADLGSRHPAGVLALAWLTVGLLCGACAAPRLNTGLGALAGPPPRHTLRRDVLIAAVVCALASTGASLLLVLTRSDGVVLDAAIRNAPAALLGDALLALAVVPLTRAALHSSVLRAPRPLTELAALSGSRHG